MREKLLLIISFGIMLAGCSAVQPQAQEAGSLTFPLEVSNQSEPVEDGEMVVALVSSDPFEGTLSRAFYSGSFDAEIMNWFDESLLSTDSDFEISNEGAASFTLSEDRRTITLRIKDGVNWHDGEPVKASDLLYAYELIGHPDYSGERYTFMIENVAGMEDYHAGKTKEISGIQVQDDQTISVTFKTASPSILSGFWSSPVPRHHTGDVTNGELTMKELESSGKIRVTPIGYGPYKIVKIVPGESVLLERNENYWRGRPQLQSVVLKTVNEAIVTESLKRGDIDIARIPADQTEAVQRLGNIELLGDVDLAYTYIGFKLGNWDEKKKENRMDPKSKLANKLVRQAMWHALDNESVGKYVYHGLRFPASTLIVPVFETYHDKKNAGRPYDPEKARALLDEAGYLDVNGDGFREDPDGQPFTLRFASMAGGDAAEPIAMYYIQNWADVGLKVELTDGRLHDFNAFYDLVKSDDPKVDIFQGAWGAGSDPDPSGLYGRSAMFNYSRYVSGKNDELLEAGTSEAAFDSQKRREIYNEWQALMAEDVPLAPTLYRYEILGVNKRVVNYSIDPKSENSRVWKWGVSE
ncbi:MULTISPECIES: oligopeptide ABC transporter substrate-binding protein [Sporosarcina]|uniref:oligopeptide ABC transporter substrate-binding protein n=1 Tax=Sporosarcina TaxID=1569 RepID=UPI00129A82A3|nr:MULTISPECIES: oligopeptide ABC transporter substrate-binding protein [Sporosarcina]GKV63859.1 ABC transporter substrate-binding protein [Sporosarcina sp. NCCP-2331]GLB54638.1 ABC transporter substrate-binding protein [Sporosarcina sp. NCCP-2378]